VVRSADIAGRVGGDEFAVILPESSASDADQLYRRVQRALAATPVEQAGRMNLSGGIAQLLEGEDPSAFFERADVALYGAKSLGKGRAVWSDANRPPGTASSR
jgi:diguanylate cyclase (GGDEF)-like protein